MDEIVWRIKQLPPNEPVGALAERTLAGLDSRGCAHLFKKCAEAQMARRAQARRPSSDLVAASAHRGCLHSCVVISTSCVIVARICSAANEGL